MWPCPRITCPPVGFTFIQNTAIGHSTDRANKRRAVVALGAKIEDFISLHLNHVAGFFIFVGRNAS